MGKYFALFFGIIFVGLVAFLLVFLLPRGATSVTDQQALIDSAIRTRFSEPVAISAKNQTAQTGLEQISLGGGSFPKFISLRDEVRYYNSRTGEVRTRSLVGDKKNSVLATIKPNAYGISWSPDGTKLIAQYQAGSVYYNLATGASKKYDATIHNPVFSLTDDTIAYVHFDAKSGDGSVSIADPLMKSFKDILATRSPNWKISWIAPHLLELLSPPGNAQTVRTIATLDTQTKWLDSIAQAYGPVDTVWSPSLGRLIYSYQAGGKTIVYRVDRATGVGSELKIGIDASKCVWSSETELYCGIPQNESGDVLSKISLETSPAVVTPLDVPRGTAAANMAQMIWDDRHASLIYKDLKDGNLYLFRPTR
ncbi:MAG: hypothetical protein A3A33_00675 [Candidatus Yanofskybacteria bacterium RIFCSPLOWO2_01_FULL_49_25]|uniref:Dipeptidylpeptidase IV N-terminal domain-containing protein n=1 Tax=Candidatus Yanofskybacteria bacterium RIFCSPLOWO2_01_FULL_49_25 TaxID=1802701 RepID=A0A1F8GWL8_9BACT|nr:MAG: hypothetical protein A3A33_00675 [Candidatus Yanofskybacteria bacterium RIFCSPLOWO2_01_FULL_49_25]